MRRFLFALAATGLFLRAGTLLGVSCTVNATTDTGAGSGTTGDLRYCITLANASTATPHTIAITATGTITLGSPLPSLGRDMTIDGPGPASLSITGAFLRQIFFVGDPASADPSPAVTISDLTLQNGRSTGFNGGGGGGGAAGMGGGLVVNAGSVVVSNVTFLGNQAAGGNGGNGSDTGVFPGGGGGAGSPGANGGFSTWGAGGNGGRFGGAAGTPGATTFDNGGPGGNGAGGGSGATGGIGGIGGGGGGGSVGASGGVGGGGGSGVSFGGLGGYGGGNGATGDGLWSFGGGGGGAGLGGAVFVANGTLTVANCTFSGNVAVGGAPGTGGWGTGGPGTGNGGAVFVHSGWLTLFGTSFSGNGDSAGAGSNATGSCASPPVAPCDPSNVRIYGGTVSCTPPAPAAFSNSPVCTGATLDLSTPAFAGATYSWAGPNGFTATSPNPSIPSVTSAAAGTYNVTVTVEGCTSAAGSTTVTVDPSPSAPTASNNGPICAGGTLNLTTPLVSGATYAWTGPSGFSSSLQNPSIASATTAASGTYSVTITVGGCTSSAGTTNATVNADVTAPSVTPPSNVTIDQTVCCGTLGGITSATSAALASFLSGATATDACDATPAALAPQVSGVDVTSSTCFATGSTTVTFRFQDDAANIGTATANVTVRMYGDVNLDDAINASDLVILRAYLNLAIGAGTPPFNAPASLADVNHDSGVDSGDLVFLRAYNNLALTCLAP